MRAPLASLALALLLCGCAGAPWATLTPTDPSKPPQAPSIGLVGQIADNVLPATSPAQQCFRIYGGLTVAADLVTARAMGDQQLAAAELGAIQAAQAKVEALWVAIQAAGPDGPVYLESGLLDADVTAGKVFAPAVKADATWLIGNWQSVTAWLGAAPFLAGQAAFGTAAFNDVLRYGKRVFTRPLTDADLQPFRDRIGQAVERLKATTGTPTGA